MMKQILGNVYAGSSCAFNSSWGTYLSYISAWCVRMNFIRLVSFNYADLIKVC